MKQIVVGGGCFWCVEAIFARVCGVVSAVSGYTGGETTDPDYKAICTGQTGHAEVVKLTYDENIISLAELLDIFFHVHDPTTLNRQGNDVGTQYRSIVFYEDEADRKIILQKIKSLESAREFPDKIVTQVQPLSVFYPAEDYHTSYFEDNPSQPYCAAVIHPKVKKFITQYSQYLAKP